VDPAALQAPPDLPALVAAADDARRQYQACRYADLIPLLSGLLGRLGAACQLLDGDDQLRAFALSADVHHVAAGLLLKLDDRGLACVAADRSMSAALASQDPVTVGASARIITHTLMDGRHLAAAVTTASSQAQKLDDGMVAHTPESLSVYGSLLLRGAVAAAQYDQRDTAYDLLAEADDAGQRLGVDGNLRWTAFGPVNARQHRVNIALTLGDAGTAIDVARGIDLRSIAVTERKASLLIDTARAFLQWGRHEKAYIALRAAEEIAPEEVTGRPSVHRLVRDLITSAPPSVRRDAEEFAAQAGITR
jgi:tetratricopeptide (TPR) repeat protein